MPTAVGRENVLAADAEFSIGSCEGPRGAGILRVPAGRQAAPHALTAYAKPRLPRARSIAAITAIVLLAGACGSGQGTAGRTTDTAATIAKTTDPSSVR
jgi:hypothetical protein